jgi:ferrous iron transport protein B
MLLKDLKIGEAAIVENVGGEGALRQHFLDMGMIPGTQLTLMKFCSYGGPNGVANTWIFLDVTSCRCRKN